MFRTKRTKKWPELVVQYNFKIIKKYKPNQTKIREIKITLTEIKLNNIKDE